MRRVSASAAVVAATAVLLGVGCSGCASRVDWGALLTAGRDGWQRPDRVVEALAILPGDRVAEIGAGDGYWLPWLSAAVGRDGIVYAVEVEAEKVLALRERVAREGLSNVQVIHGAYEDPALPDGEVDLAMTCLTYHHIESRIAYFARLREDLSTRGRVAHLDDRDDLAAPLRWLPTPGHVSNVEVMDAEMEEAGYRRVRDHDFLLIQAFREYVPGPLVAASDR